MEYSFREERRGEVKLSDHLDVRKLDREERDVVLAFQVTEQKMSAPSRRENMLC